MSTASLLPEKLNKKRQNNAKHLKTKQQQIAENAPKLEIPVIYIPENYFLFNSPIKTVFATIVKYFHNFQSKNIMA